MNANKTIYQNVDGAVRMAVYGAVGLAVDRAVYGAVYRAVDDAVVGALDQTTRHDPPHPALRDFLNEEIEGT